MSEQSGLLSPGPMRIRLAISGLAGGGSERVCLHLCNGWVRRGHEVELLLVRAGGENRAALDPRVRVFVAGAPRIRGGLWPLWRQIRRAPAVPTLVFGLDLAVGFGALQCLWAGRRCPLIYREGSSPRHNIPSASLWQYRWLVTRLQAVVAQSEDARAQLVELGVGRLPIAVIPNPCFAEAAAPDRSRQTPATEFVVLSVGRLSPEKGFDRLIRGFPSLLKQRSDARLVILGEGPARPALEALIRDLGLAGRVVLAGYRQDVDSWHRRAAVFVLASHYEGQSNATMEAIAAGCPLVSAACEGGQQELMRQCGLERWLVPAEGFESRWADYALAAAEAPSRTWQEARQRLLAWADPERVLRAYLDFCLSPTAAGS